MGYSLDLRKKVLEYIEAGGSRSSACRIFKIHRNTIVRWYKLSKQGCLSDPKPHRPWKKIDPQELIAAVTKNNNWLLADFAKLFKVTTAAICLAFKSLNITRKKRLLSIESEMRQSGNYFWQISPSTKKKI